MKLSFSIKSIGKKRPYLSNENIDLDIASSLPVKDFLEKLVVQQVNAYNQRKESRNLVAFFNEDNVQQQVNTGSLKFDEQYNTTQANSNRAVETVWEAFEDGLIAFFVNGNQIEGVNQTINLKESDSLTLIKLTFLAGSIF